MAKFEGLKVHVALRASDGAAQLGNVQLIVTAREENGLPAMDAVDLYELERAIAQGVVEFLTQIPGIVQGGPGFIIRDHEPPQEG